MPQDTVANGQNCRADGTPESSLGSSSKPLPTFRNSTVVVSLWCVLSVALGRILTALNPGVRDSQLFAYIGQQWLNGRIPYVSCWDNKPPGIFAVSAAGLSLFTRNFQSIEVLEGLFIIGAALAARALLRFWKAPPIVANFSMAAVAIGLSLQSLNEGGNLTESYLTLPAALSMLAFALYQTRNSAQYIVAAGVFSGLAALFKPVGLAPLLAQLTYTAFETAIRRKIPVSTAIRTSLLNILGVFLAWIPALLYFGAHGATSEMLNGSFFYNMGYVATGLPHYLISRPLWFIPKFESMSTILILAVLGLFYLPGRRGTGHDLPNGSGGHWALVALWAIFDLAGAELGGHGFYHYLLPLVVSLSVASGFTLWAILVRLEAYKDRSLVWTIVLLLFASLAFAQIRDVGARTRALRPRQPEASEVLAKQLKLISAQGDTLFVWPYEPAIYFMTALPSPSRFETADYAFYSAAAYQRVRSELWAALERQPPTYIVDSTLPTPSKIPMQEEQFHKEFRSFISARYELVQSVGDLRLFRIQPRAAPTP